MFTFSRVWESKVSNNETDHSTSLKSIYNNSLQESIDTDLKQNQELYFRYDPWIVIKTLTIEPLFMLRRFFRVFRIFSELSASDLSSGTAVPQVTIIVALSVSSLDWMLTVCIYINLINRTITRKIQNGKIICSLFCL
jgi:hypothetical protein